MSCETTDTELCIYRGDTIAFAVEYRDASGNPIDLTDYSARMQIRPRAGQSADPPAVELTSEPGGGIVVNGPEGRLDIELTPAQSGASLAALKQGAYDVEITSQAGRTTTLVGGSVTFVDQVTQ